MAKAPKKTEAEPKAESEAGRIPLETAAKLIMVTPRWIQQLVSKGYIPRATRGRYQTVAVVQGYIRFLKDEQKSESRSERENRVRDARAREIEQRIAEREGRLIDLAEHDAVVDELVGMVREEFGALPSQITRDAERKRDLEDKIDGIFDRIATRAEKRAASLSSGGSALQDDEEDDA